MAFSTETIGRLLASGRNYASTVVGFIGGIGVISAAQNKGLTDALNEIFTGLSQVVHGATSLWQILIVAFPIIGVVMAKIASNTAKTSNQAAAVKIAVNDPNTPVSAETKATVLATVVDLKEVPKDTVIPVNDPVVANLASNPRIVPKI